jgi:hypothetical protein
MPDVPAIQPAVLVKAAPPTNLDASTENLFSGLIPDSRCDAICYMLMRGD